MDNLKINIKFRHIFWWTLIITGSLYLGVHNFLLFHLLVELFSILVSYCITIVALNSFETGNQPLVFLGIAYAFIGGWDLLHLLTYKGMNIFSGYDADLPTQFWIIARYLESISLFIFSFLNINYNRKKVALLYLLITLILMFSILYSIFPTCYIEGQGLTTFKIISEYLIIIILLGTIYNFQKNKDVVDQDVFKLLIWAVIITILSELFFTLYVDIYGITIILGHIVKLISFYLILIALIRTGLRKPYKLIYTRFKEEKEKLHQYLNQAEVLFLVLNEKGSVEFINNKGCEILGYSREDVIGKEWIENFVPPEERFMLKEIFAQYLNGDTDLDMNINLVITKSGEKKKIEWHNTIIRNARGELEKIICSGRDTTRESELEEQIIYLDYHDKLTGLHNRNFFEKSMKRLNRSMHLPVSIIMGDVNGLKMVNDVFGYEEGNKTLKLISSIFLNSTREEDIVTRLGGDEFAILLPNTDEKAAIKIAGRIKIACNRKDQNPVQPSIALGVATRTKMDQNLNEILKKAEDRVYKNKLIDDSSIRSNLVSSLEKTLAERDYITEEHIRRVKKLAMLMGESLELTENRYNELLLIAGLHDLGKIGIPDQILKKPGSLTDEEWEIMKTHSQIGFRIAESSPQLSSVARGILHHHERWDGAGYPDGLKGKEIPLISRVVSIIDTYDVITHDRPYKKAISHQEAIKELKRCASSQFDPELVQIFVNEYSVEVK